jgi:hypothetical protein
VGFSKSKEDRITIKVVKDIIMNTSVIAGSGPSNKCFDSLFLDGLRHSYCTILHACIDSNSLLTFSKFNRGSAEIKASFYGVFLYLFIKMPS